MSVEFHQARADRTQAARATADETAVQAALDVDTLRRLLIDAERRLRDAQAVARLASAEHQNALDHLARALDIQDGVLAAEWGVTSIGEYALWRRVRVNTPGSFLPLGAVGNIVGIRPSDVPAAVVVVKWDDEPTGRQSMHVSTLDLI